MPSESLYDVIHDFSGQRWQYWCRGRFVSNLDSLRTKPRPEQGGWGTYTCSFHRWEKRKREAYTKLQECKSQKTLNAWSCAAWILLLSTASLGLGVGGAVFPSSVFPALVSLPHGNAEGLLKYSQAHLLWHHTGSWALTLARQMSPCASSGGTIASEAVSHQDGM